MFNADIHFFVKESNWIEGIDREPTEEEIIEHIRFTSLDTITIDELLGFLSVYQPDGLLRDKPNMNVRVGGYIAPRGGPQLVASLQDLLNNAPHMNAYDLHVAYEKLHPFMDGNGRSGRALWAWKRQDIRRGFLVNFYYETLKRSRG